MKSDSLLVISSFVDENRMSLFLSLKDDLLSICFQKNWIPGQKSFVVTVLLLSLQTGQWTMSVYDNPNSYIHGDCPQLFKFIDQQMADIMKIHEIAEVFRDEHEKIKSQSYRSLSLAIVCIFTIKGGSRRAEKSRKVLMTPNIKEEKKLVFLFSSD